MWREQQTALPAPLLPSLVSGTVANASRDIQRNRCVDVKCVRSVAMAPIVRVFAPATDRPRSGGRGATGTDRLTTPTGGCHMAANDPARDGAISPETARLLCNTATVVLGRVQLAQRRLQGDADLARLDGDLAAIEAVTRALIAALALPAPFPDTETPDA